jgi:hypothetical protein
MVDFTFVPSVTRELRRSLDVSRNFEPVDFGDELPLSSPAEQKPVESFPEREVFTKVVEKIHAEIEAMQNGGSKLVPRPLHFPKGNVVPAILLDRFIQNPDRKKLENFLTMCTQDLGSNAEQAFRSWFNEILKKEKVRELQ